MVKTSLSLQRKTQNRLLLDKPVTEVKFVGETTAKSLKKLGVETIEDLLYHFPPEDKYLDRSSLRSIAQVKVGEEVSVVGVVKDIQRKKARYRNMSILSVAIYDGTGYLYGIWFNQDYVARRLALGTEIVLSGKVVYEFGRLQIKNPFYDAISDADQLNETLHTNRIIPLHPATQNLSTTKLRRIIKEAIDRFSDLPDPLPFWLREKYGYLEKSLSLKEIHFPTSFDLCKKARQRLLFEELFLLQLGLALRKKRLEKQAYGLSHKAEGKLTRDFLTRLPFELTKDQKRAVSEISKDLEKPHPMSRLLQGEVGSGKTVVAVYSLLAAVQNGYQGAIMAPTEILAEQHYLKFKEFFKDLPVNLALLKGGMLLKHKEEVQKQISSGEIDIVVGTQALVQEKVQFKRLGLVVIDEQHRFGVRQRMSLKEKAIFQKEGSPSEVYYPDVLIMTATPIPRTLSLTLYGDLDVSVLKELPLNRRIAEHIKTVVCDRAHRNWSYQKIRQEVTKGRQAYIICPLVEESDKIEVKAVTEEARRLMDQIFPDLRVALIHGRFKSSEKEEIMNKFRRGEIDILISTTVVEVGIDVPSATVMLVEDAERFGLTQLHQLRGRVGRGEHQSYFILFADPTTPQGVARMKVIKETSDGFKLAQKDLEMRGEGELFGPRQAGLPDLKLAKIVRDVGVLIRARNEAFRLVDKDPFLNSPEHKLLLYEVKKKFAHNLEWLFHT